MLRIGRTAAAARGHAIEAAILPDLAPRLPVAVPIPSVYCPPSAALPFGAIGHARLPGLPCERGTATGATGRDLGMFLAALHQVDARAFPAMPDQEAIWDGWQTLQAESDGVLRDRLAAGDYDRVRTWWRRFLADRRMREYEPSVRHGDLWYGNLLVRSDGSITAVLDWEAVATADPAQDLALTRYVGPAFTATVLAAYRRHGGAHDDQIQYRMDRHWELRELTGIPLAAAVGDQDEVAECIAKLRAGPILAPGQ
jgi:aminoglycoside phosphotransferase (APT) family kinase protein